MTEREKFKLKFNQAVMQTLLSLKTTDIKFRVLKLKEKLSINHQLFLVDFTMKSSKS